MTILFAGGDDIQFTKIGAASSLNVSEFTGIIRSNSRCSLSSNASAANKDTTAWYRKFSTSFTSIWATYRLYHNNNGTTANFPLFVFTSGNAIKRLGIVGTGGTNNKLSIGKISAANVYTTLATEQGEYVLGLFKYDIQIINYGVNGTVNLYRNNVLIISFTGDLTTDGNTSLDGIRLGSPHENDAHYFSEIIVATSPTANLGVVAMEPILNGNLYNFTGSFADVDETILSDTDIITASNNNDTAQFRVETSRLGTFNHIAGVCVSTRVSSGNGLSNIQLGVRTGGVDAWTSNIPVGGFLQTVEKIFELNPNTGQQFTASEITSVGYNIGLRATT